MSTGSKDILIVRHMNEAGQHPQFERGQVFHVESVFRTLRGVSFGRAFFTETAAWADTWPLAHQTLKGRAAMCRATIQPVSRWTPPVAVQRAMLAGFDQAARSLLVEFADHLGYPEATVEDFLATRREEV